MGSFRSAVACLAVAVHAAVGFAYPAGVVLCIAADGHLAVETAHETVRCTAELERHHPGSAGASDLDGHPCTDTFVSQPVMRDGCPVPPVGTNAPLVPAWPAPVPGPVVTRLPSPGHAPPPAALRALRSVVLLA